MNPLNEQFVHQGQDSENSEPAEDSLDLDRYIEEVLGSLLDDDYAVTDENIFDDSFTDRSVTGSPDQLTGGGGGLSYKIISTLVMSGVR